MRVRNCFRFFRERVDGVPLGLKTSDDSSLKLRNVKVYEWHGSMIREA